MNDTTNIIMKRFLCGYCNCIFLADRTSYKIVHINEFEYKYECHCPYCRRVTEQVIGTTLKTVSFEKPKKSEKKRKKS